MQQTQVPATDTALKAEYKFKVTDGAGNIYMDFTSSALDVQRLNNSDAAIKSAVEASLSANFATFRGHQDYKGRV